MSKKTPLVFSHGNGFPASSYKKLFSFLESDYDIKYIDTIGLGDYPINLNWTNSVHELIDFIESNFEQPVIAAGHSFGGVLSILASNNRPDLFEQVVAIDPPLFGVLKRYIIGTLRIFNKDDLVFKLPVMAKKRKDKFESREEAFEYFRKKPFFKSFDPDCLHDYVENGLIESESGELRLKIPKRVEEQIFKYMPCFLHSEILRPKNCTFLYGDTKSAHDRFDILWLKNMLRGAKFREYSGTHMFPMENPKGCSDLLKTSFIS